MQICRPFSQRVFQSLRCIGSLQPWELRGQYIEVDLCNKKSCHALSHTRVRFKYCLVQWLAWSQFTQRLDLRSLCNTSEFCRHVLLWFPKVKTAYVKTVLGDVLFLQTECTLTYNGPNQVGWYGVTIMIEDFNRRRPNRPLSRVRLLLWKILYFQGSFCEECETILNALH